MDREKLDEVDEKNDGQDLEMKKFLKSYQKTHRTKTNLKRKKMSKSFRQFKKGRLLIKRNQGQVQLIYNIYELKQTIIITLKLEDISPIKY